MTDRSIRQYFVDQACVIQNIHISRIKPVRKLFHLLLIFVCFISYISCPRSPGLQCMLWQCYSAISENIIDCKTHAVAIFVGSFSGYCKFNRFSDLVSIYPLLSGYNIVNLIKSCYTIPQLFSIWCQNKARLINKTFQFFLVVIQTNIWRQRFHSCFTCAHINEII